MFYFADFFCKAWNKAITPIATIIKTINTENPCEYPANPDLFRNDAITGGIKNPPKAPNPPIHPEAPPIASGTALGTILNTAAFATPIPIASKIIPIIAKVIVEAKVIQIAPISAIPRETIVVISPPFLSATFPPYILVNEVNIEYKAVKRPATFIFNPK